MYCLSLLLGAATLISPIFAQTWTTCNPLNTTCPNDPALGLNHTFYFNQSSTVTDTFNITAGSLVYGPNGTEFTVAKKGDSPTIQSQWYIFFGSVSVIMKAATGQGIVSSIVLESDDLDEVDWEFMGGNGTHAETNYFGKGNETAYNRAIYYPVDSDPRENFHNYTTYWNSSQLEWYIDGVLVRTLPYAAANGGDNYPQTPMTLRMGIWAGGDPDNSEGTIEWAGGLTNYDNGPYTMVVQSAHVNDFTTGSSYEYTDHSGSWQSIKAIAGNSTAATTIIKAQNQKPSLSLAQKFAALPQTTKLAIYGGAGGAGALLLAALLFTCIRQRRAGRRERDAYNAKVEKERENVYKEQMELRQKGLGGWDQGAYERQGEDALGGWGGNHVTPGSSEADLPPKMPGSISLNEVPSRSSSPTIPRMGSPAQSQRVMSPTIPRMGSPAQSQRAMSPAISRMGSSAQSQRAMSPPPASPISPQSWTGEHQNAGSAYSGGYGGSTNVVPRSPPFSSTSPQQNQPRRGYTGGYTNGGYQRF